MKPAYKGRKPPIESLRPQNSKLPPIESQSKLQPSQLPARKINTPGKFPPNRVILRNSKQKDLEGIPKMLSNEHLQTKNLNDSDNEDHILENQNSFRMRQESVPEEFLEARDRKTIVNYEFR